MSDSLGAKAKQVGDLALQLGNGDPRAALFIAYSAAIGVARQFGFPDAAIPSGIKAILANNPLTGRQQ